MTALSNRQLVVQEPFAHPPEADLGRLEEVEVAVDQRPQPVPAQLLQLLAAPLDQRLGIHPQGVRRLRPAEVEVTADELVEAGADERAVAGAAEEEDGAVQQIHRLRGAAGGGAHDGKE
jgi:hypothetical protein